MHAEIGQHIYRRSGFTLVELLVAILISSILVLALYQGLGLGMRLWKRVEGCRPAEEQARRIISLLREELAGLYFPTLEKRDGPGFQYKENAQSGEWKIVFWTTHPAYKPTNLPAKCARVTYEYRIVERMVGQEQPEGVVIRRGQLAGGGKNLAGTGSGVIAHGLASFKLTLVRDKTSGQGGGNAKEKPPRLVQYNAVWPMQEAMSGKPGVLSFSGQIFVPVKGELAGQES